jgi:diaminopimelate decarboxylase
MLNIGGGMPAVYRQGQALPAFSDFAAALRPLLRDYHVILEPGRAIIADAGVLVTTILYVKKQAGQTLYIVDAGMTELIRPALYEAVHEFVPLRSFEGNIHRAAQVVGPVCESSDVLGQEVMLPELRPGDRLAILTAGAYGMVMASNYNARPRPPEVVVTAQGNSAFVARARETWEDLLRGEV